MEQVNVPPYFLCPISLQIMSDPVTLSTGITYDRSSIRRWLSSASTPICPVTRRPLPDARLTPNSTLLRLIRSWCAANPAADVPRPPQARVDAPTISRLLRDLRRPNPHPDSLRKLRDIIAGDDENRRAAEEADAGDVMVQLVKNSTVDADECIDVLHRLRLSEESLRELAVRNADLVETLTGVLRGSTCCQTRAHAVSIARSLFEAVSPERLVAVRGEFFKEVVRVVADRISQTATKAALRVLRELMPWGRNRVRAAEVGVAEAVIELLLDERESRRMWEMGMVVMEMVCGCAEGRQAVVGHPAGIAVVSRATVGISAVASEKAARVLCAVAKHAGRAEVVREMAEVGAVSKLCIAGLAEGGRTRERVAEVLRLHSKAWAKSPCVNSGLLSPWL